MPAIRVTLRSVARMPPGPDHGSPTLRMPPSRPSRAAAEAIRMPCSSGPMNRAGCCGDPDSADSTPRAARRLGSKSSPSRSSNGRQPLRPVRRPHVLVRASGRGEISYRDGFRSLEAAHDEADGHLRPDVAAVAVDLGEARVRAGLEHGAPMCALRGGRGACPLEPWRCYLRSTVVVAAPPRSLRTVTSAGWLGQENSPRPPDSVPISASVAVS